MSRVRQRTQPLSCSRHKRNGYRAQAQAALPTMMSGLDGCLRADVTWVGEGAGKKKKRVFMSAFLLPNAGGGQEPDRVRHGRLVYTYKRVVCVCLFVCWSAFYRPHDICPLCGTASECPRAAKPSQSY